MKQLLILAVTITLGYSQTCPCPPVPSNKCTVEGDPHFRTFDIIHTTKKPNSGASLQQRANDDGPVLIAAPCDAVKLTKRSSMWDIWYSAEPYGKDYGNGKAVKSVTVRIGKAYKIEFQPQAAWSILVTMLEGTETISSSNPSWTENGIDISHQEQVFTIKYNNEFNLSCNVVSAVPNHNNMRLGCEVDVTTAYNNHMIGMCGNMNQVLDGPDGNKAVLSEKNTGYGQFWCDDGAHLAADGEVCHKTQDCLNRCWQYSTLIPHSASPFIGDRCPDRGQ